MEDSTKFPDSSVSNTENSNFLDFSLTSSKDRREGGGFSGAVGSSNSGNLSSKLSVNFRSISWGISNFVGELEAGGVAMGDSDLAPGDDGEASEDGAGLARRPLRFSCCFSFVNR